MDLTELHDAKQAKKDAEVALRAASIRFNKALLDAMKSGDDLPDWVFE